MTKLQDKAFLDQFRINHPQTETTLNIRGFDYPCIGEYRSHWSDVCLQGEMSNGFLLQKGFASLVNPDKKAAIAFMTLESYLYSYFVNEKFQQTRDSIVKLVAHPRDLSSLHLGDQKKGIDPVITFALNLQKQIPEAPFTRDMGDAYRMMSYAYGYHTDFLERHLGGRGNVSPYGVAVFHANMMGCTSPEATLRLFDAPMLSTNPEIRQGFKDIFSGILGGQAQLLPRTTQLLEMHP